MGRKRQLKAGKAQPVKRRRGYDERGRRDLDREGPWKLIGTIVMLGLLVLPVVINVASRFW